MAILALVERNVTYANIDPAEQKSAVPARRSSDEVASPLTIAGPLAGIPARNSATSTPLKIRLSLKTGGACVDIEAAIPRTRAPTPLQKISSYGVPVVDAVAAGLSLAAFRLSMPLAVKITGTSSGVLWAGGAGASELANSPRSKWVSTANFLSGAAGVLSATAPFVFGESESGTVFGAAGAWAGNGAATMMRAASVRGQTTAHRVFLGVGGAANVAAAGLAAGAGKASLDEQSIKAINLGTASAILWGIGAAAAIGAARTSRVDNVDDSLV